MLLIIVTIFSCTDKIYYNEIWRNGITNNIEGNSYTYYVPVFIRFNDSLINYITPIENIKDYIDEYNSFKTCKFKKRLLNNNGVLIFDNKNIIYEDRAQDRVIFTSFYDSIASLSTPQILKAYFINDNILDTNKISYEEKKQLIYLLVTRKELVHVLTGDHTYYSKNPVYFGKIPKDSLNI